MSNAYKDLSEGFKQIGVAFKAISEDVDNPPAVKILVMQIAEKMNLGDDSLVELINFLKFCTDNDDLDMKKLAKELSGEKEAEASEDN